MYKIWDQHLEKYRKQSSKQVSFIYFYLKFISFQAKRIIKKLEKLNDKQLEKAESDFWTKIDEIDTICYTTYKPIEAFFDAVVRFFVFI